MGTRRGDPKPFALNARDPRVRTCVASSWLHPFKNWSFLKKRGGSRPSLPKRPSWRSEETESIDLDLLIDAAAAGIFKIPAEQAVVDALA